MSKPIAEMTEDELYERMNELYNRRAEIVKEMRAIDEEAYKIEFKLMGGMQCSTHFYWRAADECCGVNFHYTIPPAICQAKSEKKLHKIKIPELCNLYVKQKIIGKICATFFSKKGCIFLGYRL